MAAGPARPAPAHALRRAHRLPRSERPWALSVRTRPAPVRVAAMDCISIESGRTENGAAGAAAWRVVITLRQLPKTLRSAAYALVAQKPSAYALPLRRLYEFGRGLLSPRHLLALAPLMCYLMVFQNHARLRSGMGLDQRVPPSVTFLPWLERTLFLCHPHRLLGALAHPILDILAAAIYLLHFPLPVLFVLYLYLSPRRRRDVLPFLWLLGWVNFITVLFQLLFPTAPPWYVDSVVLDAGGRVTSGPTNPPEAGFQRLDAMLGYPLFHGIYSRSPLKFGAFPSLHVAWPTAVLAVGPWLSFRVGVLHVVWITLAALYSGHHYLVDAVMGIAIVAFVVIMSSRVYSPFTSRTIDYASQLPPSQLQLPLYSAGHAPASVPTSASGQAPAVSSLPQRGPTAPLYSSYWTAKAHEPVPPLECNVL